MSDEITKTSKVQFDIGLDENHIPLKIDWKASDSGQGGEAKAIMLSMWDGDSENAMRIDLWNKDMRVDEMKRFVHQTMLTMSDSFEKATGEKPMAGAMREFARYFAEKMELIDPREEES